jgi:hypothetical protein
MHFKVSEWTRKFVEEHPDEEVVCPYRVLDPATGFIISGVTEFNDDDGWLRVLCRDQFLSTPDKPRWAVHPELDELITQIKHIPFQVVPCYDGIDDLPVTHVDDLEFKDGKPVGDWLPAPQPYQSQDEV